MFIITESIGIIFYRIFNISGIYYEELLVRNTVFSALIGFKN